ncbi:unnamed protein product [Peniophora sp. CBMAI 1063]|nr:unnamed protein product [Peniophora sp. CBMAI 1063]
MAKKPKRYIRPQDETYVILVNPPRVEQNGGQGPPDGKIIQAWISAITSRDDNPVVEIFTVASRSEPILRLENVDIENPHLLGLHRWREILCNPTKGFLTQETLIVEYDFERCNDPGVAGGHQRVFAEHLDGPGMLADFKQPYPRPHLVDSNCTDTNLRVSEKANQIIKRSSFPKLVPQDQHPHPAAPKAEQDLRPSQLFDGIDQEVKAYHRTEARAVDLRPGQVFDGIEQEVKAVLQAESKLDARRDRRAEVVFDGIEDEIRRHEEYESRRASTSSSATLVQTKQEDMAIKREYDTPVKQDDASVKQEDPIHPVAFSGAEDRGGRTFLPRTSSGFSKGSIKRGRDVEDIRGPKRFKTEY